MKYENNSLKSNLLIIIQDENKTYSTSKCLNDYELEPFNTHGELPLKIKVHGVVHTIIFSKEDVALFVNLFE
ncbi:hypothetical protein LG296_20495 (plasmid) [Ureibacillus chungkukjangi]|uniref:hypothetical protein n=1 Tax=Ureibacillus chungkukjangi TaxID=1202712 RepID=UPI000D363EFB